MSFLRRSKGKQVQQIPGPAGLGSDIPGEQVCARMRSTATDYDRILKNLAFEARSRDSRVGLAPRLPFALGADAPSSIVAVHGLGGHWESTWKDSETNKVWLRDFLPSQLRDANIKPRIFSYGYNSKTAFSKSIMDVNDVADDLLDRLSLVRQSAEEKSRPILLIAHSLGGLIVKKAIITAWNQSNQYGELLGTLRGIVFFGVPHRGADIAYWAGLPANLLDHTLLGFGGNTAFLNALKRASPVWRDISIQFIERAKPPLKIRTFFETERLGNILVVDKDSARLYLPNEQFTGVSNSNHKSMCKFDSAESQRYSPVWMAIRNMAQEAIAPTITTYFKNREAAIITDTPAKIPKFFGRESELLRMRKLLKSEGSGQKCVVLWGLSGFGKTQLALEFNSLYSKDYTSKIWIDVTMASQAETLASLNIDIAEVIPPGPTMSLSSLSVDMSSPTLPFSRIKAWLARDTNRDWLMIIDNVDDLDGRIQIQQLLPQCEHGTVIITTTRSNLVSVLRVHGIEVAKIGEDAGIRIFQDKFRSQICSSEELQLIKTLVYELDRVPLAIEQAAIDLSLGSVLSTATLQRYLLRLKEEYQRIMMIKPDVSEWYYDKNRSIIKTFSILKEALAKSNADSVQLLTFASFFATGNIPIILVSPTRVSEDDLQTHCSPGAEEFLAVDGQEIEIFQWMNQLSDESCERAIFLLQKFCCVKVNFDTRGIRGFVIQEAIRRWCQEALSAAEAEEWALLVAYRISECLRPDDPSITTLRFLPHIRFVDRLLFQNDHFLRIRAPNDFCRHAWFVSLRFAHFYYQHKYFSDAGRSMERAIDYERLILDQEWMKTFSSLKRMQFWSIILRDQGDFTRALEIAQTLIPACEKVLGSDHDLTIEIGTWSTALRVLSIESSQSQQRVLTAFNTKRNTSDQTLQESPPTGADNLAPPEYAELSVSDKEYSLRERVRGFISEYGEGDPGTLEALNDLATFYVVSQRFVEASSIFKAVWQGRAKLSGSSIPTTLVLRPFYDYRMCSKLAGCPLVPLEEEYPTILIYAIRRHYMELIDMLIEEQFDLSICDEEGWSALHTAARDRNEKWSSRIVEILLRQGASVAAVNINGMTPLACAAINGHRSTVKLLLEKEAEVDLMANDGATSLHHAAQNGDTETVDALIKAQANVDAREKQRATPLHFAALNGHTETVSALIRAKAKVDAQTKAMRTPLHYAAQNGHTETVNALIKARADVDALEMSKWTALHFAAEDGHTETVNALIEAKAKVDAREEDQRTALHLAAANGHTETVNALIKAQADVDGLEMSKWTALHFAAEDGHTETVNALIKAQAEVDALGEYGATPLHLATLNGHTETVNVLTRALAGVDAREADSATPLHVVSSNGHTETKQLTSP